MNLKGYRNIKKSNQTLIISKHKNDAEMQLYKCNKS